MFSEASDPLSATSVVCSLGSGSTVVIASPPTSLVTVSASHSAMGGRMSEMIRSARRPRPSSVSDNYSDFINLVSDGDSDSSDDSDLRQASQQSLMEKSYTADGGSTSAASTSAACISLKDVLVEHIAKHVCVSDDYSFRQLIPVRRREVWNDTLRCMRQPTFDFTQGLNVNFITFSNKLEEAVDEGGPTREYLRLLLKGLSNNSGLLCGLENRRTAAHNLSALHKGEYRRIGQCIALSMFYNGPGPHFFSTTATNYFLDIPIGNIPHEDIPDYEIREKVLQLERSESTESLRILLDDADFSFRFDCGVCMPSSSISIDDKEDIVRCIGMHYIIYSVKAELDQIKEGFQTLHLSDLLKQHANLVKPLFLESGLVKLTSSGVLELFIINWSEEGSNKREAQEEVVLNLTYYLANLQEGDPSFPLTPHPDAKKVS